MQRKWIVFACAAACLIAVPIVVNALAFKFGRTPNEERQAQAFLYLGVDVTLLVTIFCFGLLG